MTDKKKKKNRVVRKLQRNVACRVRCVHASVNGSFCSVLAKQVFPLTSELRGGIGTRELAERDGDREMNGVQGC